MSAYSHPVQTISDISPYFKKNDKTFEMVFVGETLELRIPRKFAQQGVLTIGDTVTTPGVMDMIIDGRYQTGLNMLASITVAPTDMGQMTYKGLDYLVLYLKTGDVFMTSYRVIQNPDLVYALWTDFITNGAVPYFMNSYSALLKLFEHVWELTGSGIGVSRSVFEGIIAHIARDANRIDVQYRLTDMQGPMKLVALRSVSQAPSSTLARLNGAYFRDDGLTSALRYEVTETQPFENILRGLPAHEDSLDDLQS